MYEHHNETMQSVADNLTQEKRSQIAEVLYTKVQEMRIKVNNKLNPLIERSPLALQTERNNSLVAYVESYKKLLGFRLRLLEEGKNEVDMSEAQLLLEDYKRAELAAEEFDARIISKSGDLDLQKDYRKFILLEKYHQALTGSLITLQDTALV